MREIVHEAGINVAGFFPIDTALGERLYARAFLEHGTRRLHITGVTIPPARDRATWQAGNPTAELGTRMDTPRFLPCDRDGTYAVSFDAVFEAEDMNVIKSAPRAPRMTSHCERAIGGIRRLNHVLIMGQAHARQVLAACQRHNNRTRDQLSSAAHQQPAAVHDLDARRLLRTRVLGGIINEYRYTA